MTTPSPGIMNHLPRDASFGQRRVDDLERKLREGLAARAAEATSIANGATLLRDSADQNTLVSLGTDPDTGDHGVNVNSGGAVNVHGGGGVNVNDGGALAVHGGGGIEVNDGGGLVVNDGGSAQVRGGGQLQILTYDNAGVLLRLGFLPDMDKPQNGFVIRSVGPGGEYTVLDLADRSNDGLPLHQVLSIRDTDGIAVLAPDALSGKGLANPHVSDVTLVNTNVLLWPQTTNTGWTTIAHAYMEIQNPKLTWQIEHTADTSGQIRVLLDGAQVGSGVEPVSSSFGTWSTDAGLPAGVAIGDVKLVELQARVTGGSGSCYAQAMRFTGQQSS